MRANLGEILRKGNIFHLMQLLLSFEGFFIVHNTVVFFHWKGG
jgi:hypothetical protein